jgi:cytochrome b subunit of formate dehydrogenase
MQADIQIPRRFTVPQRIEHGFLAISFTVLGLTGLIQKFGLNPLSERLISVLGGIEMTRIIHRAAAIVFALLTVYHAIVIAHKFFIRRIQMTMMPDLKDVTDGLHCLGYSLFLRKEPPQMPRYNFAEKLEYWALIWGGLIMIVTGFMLWNPLITTMFLPGQFIPAAKAAHGGEAVLAVLAIIVWHFYNVHLKMFNTSMFTGKLTPHQIEEEHGAEWSGLVSSSAIPVPVPATGRRRQFIFVPAAILFAVLGVWGIYWAATAETTAISTLPAPASRLQIYSPAVSSPEFTTESATVPAPMIPHQIAGLEQCYKCHGKSAMKPVPSNHEGRPVESCRICHKPGPPAKAKKPPVEEKASGPKAIPHATDKAPYKNCMMCHGTGKLKPFPENHSSYPMESCTICHQ